MRRRIATGSMLATLALAAASARAQEGPADVARRDLIAQGEAVAAAGDHARAVQLGERAAQLRVTPTIQYFLAREHLALDHPLEALAYGGACARAAEADLALHNRDGVLAACRAIVTTTEPRVGRVMVHVPSGSPAGLVVRVQRAELPATLYDVEYPVAPGAVVVEASAPGHLPFRREMTVTASHTFTLDVHLDPAPVVALPQPVVRLVTPVAPRVDPPPHSYSVGPWIVAGAGVATLILGGVFYGLAAGERSDRDAACVNGCTPDAPTHDTSYAGYLTDTNALLGVGAAVLVGGATWFIVDRVTHRAVLSGHAAPTAGGLTLGLTGRF